MKTVFDNLDIGMYDTNKHMLITRRNNMKIVVSSSGKEKESLLDTRFGRCDFFQMYDTETQTFTVMDNSGVNASGGAGIKAATQIVDAGAEVVITGNLGPNAFEVLEKAGVSSFSCNSVTVLEAIALYQSNQLQEISMAGQAHHGM